MVRGFLAAGIGLALSVPAFGNDIATNRETNFTVRIENITKGNVLKLSNGADAPFALSPGLYVIHRKKAPIFSEEKPDRRRGLEAQAEDGNPSALAESVRNDPDVLASGIFNVPVGDSAPGPITPGKRYEFSFTAPRGSRLTLTTMFGQSNDLFYAPGESGVLLYDPKGNPVSGNLTSKMILWDAGTEVNQEPGAGPDQAPRQKGPNTGAEERGVVRNIKYVKDGYKYPETSAVLRVTITPAR